MRDSNYRAPESLPGINQIIVAHEGSQSAERLYLPDQVRRYAIFFQEGKEMPSRIELGERVLMLSYNLASRQVQRLQVISPEESGSIVDRCASSPEAYVRELLEQFAKHPIVHTGDIMLLGYDFR